MVVPLGMLPLSLLDCVLGLVATLLCHLQSCQAASCRVTTM